MVVSIAELAGRVFESRHSWERCVRHATFVGQSVVKLTSIVELTSIMDLHREAYSHRGDLAVSIMELTSIVELLLS